MSKLHYLAFSRASGIGAVTARKLIERFGGVEAVFEADDTDLLAVPRVTPDIVRALREVPLDALEEEIELLDQEGLRVLTWEDEDYPANLASAPDSPYLLYVYGDLLPEDARSVAVVGTREPSERAIEWAESIARGLAERGVTVVSGLAIGIDAAAHRGALNADAGRTLAVLGSGLRMIHPRSNVALAQEVSERGAIVSEYHPNTPVAGPALMARDRIVSGLSLGVVVVEAETRSGSTDTAEKARRQNRLVFAIPGSPGTDALISSGAISLAPGDADSVLTRLADVPSTGSEQLGLW